MAKSVSWLTVVFLAALSGLSALAAERLAVACPLKPDPPPNIDGDSREWDHLPVEIMVGAANVTWGKAKWDGEDDLSGLVKLCHDANYLYVLAEVVDEKVTIAGGKDMFHCDHVEITFAPVFDPAGSGPMRPDWRIIGLCPGTMAPTGDIFSDIEPEAYLHHPINTDSSTIDVGAGPTENGFVLEARIPWKLLGVPRPPKPGQAFGFDIHLSDSDSGTTQETMTSLNPTPWAGRKQENILKLILTGTYGKLPVETAPPPAQ